MPFLKTTCKMKYLWLFLEKEIYLDQGKKKLLGQQEQILCPVANRKAHYQVIFSLLFYTFREWKQWQSPIYDIHFKNEKNNKVDTYVCLQMYPKSQQIQQACTAI